MVIRSYSEIGGTLVCTLLFRGGFKFTSKSEMETEISNNNKIESEEGEPSPDPKSSVNINTFYIHLVGHLPLAQTSDDLSPLFMGGMEVSIHGWNGGLYSLVT